MTPSASASELVSRDPAVSALPASLTGAADPVPLVVDLDGTLIKTDLLLEMAVALLRKNPLYLFMLPLWLLRGKRALKSELAQRVTIDAALLPYNAAFLDYLRRQQAGGRSLILATASHRLPA